MSSILRRAKHAVLTGADRLGAFSGLARSAWRRRRLLILAYHGISLADEHEWSGDLYIRPALFRRRLQILREDGYTVVPLAEGVERLAAGTLPPKAVVITFDDGFADFHLEAYPLLREFGVHATLYLTTHYCQYNRPVFDPMVSYLLWRGRGRVLDNPEIPIGRVDLSTPGGRRDAERRLDRLAQERAFGSEEKDTLLGRVAAELGLDYEELTRQRLLHIMTPDEVAGLDPDLVTVELHTHRHRVPVDEALFRREIRDNRAAIGAITGRERTLRHFCYPSGVTNPAYLPWLRADGVVSATTCVPGIAAPHSDPLLLPRLLDTEFLTEREFRGWLNGISAFLPRRRPPSARR